MARDKDSARRAARAALARLSPEERAAASARLCARLAEHPVLADPSCCCILTFWPLPQEPDLRDLGRLLPGKTWLYPRIVPGSPLLACHAVQDPASGLVPGPLGTRHPDPGRCPECLPARLGACLVPGLAFVPSTGARLGRGGGYFDRFLALPDLRARTLGVGFLCQAAQALPLEPHDVLLDEVLLE